MESGWQLEESPETINKNGCGGENSTSTDAIKGERQRKKKRDARSFRETEIESATEIQEESEKEARDDTECQI